MVYDDTGWDAVTTGRTLADARRLDLEDPLSVLRDRFVIDDDPVAYLDGNSLGRLPNATADRVREVIDEQWGRRLIRGWEEGWSDLPTTVGDRLAAVVLGADPGQTALADSTTVNLYKAISAAVALRPDRHELVIDEANFPTDRYVVEAVARSCSLDVRWIAPADVGGVTVEALASHLGPATAAVVISHVDYRSGFLADMGGLTRLAHEAGALAVWDLCHSAGVVPTALDEAEVDFAVGCTYKYLNAGPGAPAFLYMAARHHSNAEQPVTGWFGAQDVFTMAPRYEPATGIRRMLSGTPNVLGAVCVDAGLDAIAEAGLERIRVKSVALTQMVMEMCDSLLGPLGWKVVSPRDPARRGSHVTVSGPDAEAVVRRMVALGAIPDFRHPSLVRLGLSPLTTSFSEAWHGVMRLAEAVRGSDKPSSETTMP